MEMTDQAIIAKCLEGNQEMFAELVTRYKRLIYSVVYNYLKDSEETNDVSQEVFIKIYKALGSYDPQYKFSTWSVRIASNLCLDILRKRKVTAIPIETIESVSRETDTPEARYLKKERRLQIRQAIARLPEKYRTLIVLYHEKGANYKEMAEILNKPLSIIKNRLYRARLMLKDQLEALGEAM